MNDLNKESHMTPHAESHREQEMPHSHRPTSRVNWVLIGFLLIIGYFLIMEHRAHLLAWLPWLLLIAFLLLHVFMHGKHGGGHRH